MLYIGMEKNDLFICIYFNKSTAMMSTKALFSLISVTFRIDLKPYQLRTIVVDHRGEAFPSFDNDNNNKKKKNDAVTSINQVYLHIFLFDESL